MNRHDQFFKVREIERTTWRDYAFAIVWALAMAYLAVQFI